MTQIDDQGVERRIVIGLVVSTTFASKIRTIWKPDYMQSEVSRRLCEWCFEYFDKYNKAPWKNIEGVFRGKVQAGGLSRDLAEEIEEEILPSLSSEYAERRRGRFNVEYLIDQTLDYFRARRLVLHNDNVADLVSRGEQREAEKVAGDYVRLTGVDEREGIDVGGPESIERIDRAFSEELQRVISYKGALGRLFNDQLVRGGFVSFLAPEKRGKSYMLLELAIRAVRQGSNVVFFQAGDMTEGQQLKRITSYLTERPDREPLGITHVPIADCLLNQADACDREEREGSLGLGISGWEDVKRDLLVEKLRDLPKYKPCTNCSIGRTQKPSVYFETRRPAMLTVSAAKKSARRFFEKYRSCFKLSTHVNGELSPAKIRSLLSLWETSEDFVPDVVVVDYADLLSDGGNRDDYRHRVDAIWKSLRALSQEKHCLVLSATQADAKSYTRQRLGLSNFSEDKRKYAHVTAMYGLNQDPSGREKKLGLLRINELVVREKGFAEDNEVYIRQALDLGRPYLGGFRPPGRLKEEIGDGS